MPSRIILGSEEPVLCPHCNAAFPIHRGITQHTIQKYEQEFELQNAQQREELSEEIRKQEERKAKQAYADRQTRLEEELQAKADALLAAQQSMNKAVEEARRNSVAQFEAERATLAQDLAQQALAIKTYRDNELALRKEKQELLLEKQNLELEVARRIDAERQAIAEQAAKAAAERFYLKEAEYKKQLEDAQKNVEELTRKLERGSQQLQGEVLELELEQLLSHRFPHDAITPVRKGLRGADILQTVRTVAGHDCGTIIWEAKRAEHWSDKWVQKLKDDQMEAKAQFAVIVSTCLPDARTDPFILHEGVWVVRELVVVPVAQTLRMMLTEVYNVRLANTGRNEKMQALYDYMCSSQFTQRVRAVVETFAGMKRDLDQERAAMERIWKKRAMQIERVTVNMSGMVGELQAIAHDSLPQLELIDTLSLPMAPEPQALAAADPNNAPSTNR